MAASVLSLKTFSWKEGELESPYKLQFCNMTQSYCNYFDLTDVFPFL